MYFGEQGTVEERIAQSEWLQTEGMKAIFEETRKQAPRCSAALNWCFNEPWITAANCSVVAYPAIPKKGYYAMEQALRPSLFSARIPTFDWKSGDRFTAEIWLLNDSPEAVNASVEVSLQIGDRCLPLLKWDGAATEPQTNLEGATVCCELPRVEADHMTLILKSDNEALNSEYKLRYELKKILPRPKGMNM